MSIEDELETLKLGFKQLYEMHVQTVGRISALEIIAARAVYDRAMIETNPFEWVQDYVRLVTADTKQMISPANPMQQPMARAAEAALEEFLEALLRMAGSLPGAPSNRAS